LFINVPAFHFQHLAGFFLAYLHRAHGKKMAGTGLPAGILPRKPTIKALTSHT